MKAIIPDSYPENYDWLSKSKQTAIIKELNHLHNELCAVRELHRQYPILADKKPNTVVMREMEIKHIISAYNLIGIYPEYGWVGHRSTYFLATRKDAEMEEDWEFQCTDYDD